MKTIYFILAVLSALMMTGECESVIALIVWDTIWFLILTFSLRRLEAI